MYTYIVFSINPALLKSTTQANQSHFIKTPKYIYVTSGGFEWNQMIQVQICHY